MKPDRRIDLQHEIRRLGQVFNEAARSLERIAEMLAVDDPSATSPPAETDAGPAEQLVTAARKVMSARPEHSWRQATLMNAVADALNLTSLPKNLAHILVEAGAVEKTTKGTYRLRVAKPARAEQAKPAAPRDWAAIVETALAIMHGEPERWWRPIELCRVVADRGGGSLRGMHFGIVRHLQQRIALARDPAGRIKLASLPPETITATDANHAAPSEPPMNVQPAAHDVGDWTEPLRMLAEEVSARESDLLGYSKRGRTAQIAAWAGRARAIQQRIATARQDTPTELRRLFGRLTALTREMECSWVDALTPTWSVDDWSLYVKYNEATAWGHEPELTADEEAAYHRAILRGLFAPRRRVTPFDAGTVILEALEVLLPDDEMVVEAIRRFGDPRPGRPSVRRERPRIARADPSPRHTIEASVLDATRGKRVLIAGGQGERDAHREALRDAFGLAEVDWVISERGKAAPFQRLAERIRPGRYDFVVFLAGYTSHQSAAFIRSCKEAALPVVYLPRGYSVASVADAISKQLVPRAHEDRSVG